MTAIPMSEAQLQAAVLELNQKLPKARRWKCYHVFDSRRSEAGWPDLAMVRGERLLFVELKRDGKDPTAAQFDWLCALDDVRETTVRVWRPGDWRAGTIEAMLR